MSEQTTTLQESLTATLLKSVLPNSLLKEIMTDALVMRTYAGNFDTRLSAGIYGVTPAEASNFPPGANKYGVLIVSCSNHYGVQIYITRGAPAPVYVRTFITIPSSDADFSAWSVIQTALAS